MHWQPSFSWNPSTSGNRSDGNDSGHDKTTWEVVDGEAQEGHEDSEVTATDGRKEKKWTTSQYDKQLLGPLGTMEPAAELNLEGRNMEQSIFQLGSLEVAKRGLRRLGRLRGEARHVRKRRLRG